MTKHIRAKTLGNELGLPADAWIDDDELAVLPEDQADPGFRRILDAVLGNPELYVLRSLGELAFQFGFDPTDPHVIERAIANAQQSQENGRRWNERRQELRRGHDPVVYYMRLGDRVKIGTTKNIMARLETFNPEELMALEKGGHSVERARHRTFDDLRTSGEWFRLEHPLDAFVALVGSNFEKEFGMTMKEWMLGHVAVRDDV